MHANATFDYCRAALLGRFKATAWFIPGANAISDPELDVQDLLAQELKFASDCAHTEKVAAPQMRTPGQHHSASR